MPAVPSSDEELEDADDDADTLPYSDTDDLFVDRHELHLASHLEALDGHQGSSEPDACHFAGQIHPSARPVPDHVQEPLELIVVHPLTRWLETPVQDPTAYVVIRCFASGQRETLIERELNVLTAAECRQHAAKCKQAMIDELRRWQGLEAFERCPRSQADNLIDARWVLKWKVVNGERLIKARLTVRGFRDMQASQLSTFSGTTSRWGQRIVVSVAVQRRWSLFSCDVAQAFLRGLSFRELAEMDGEVKRSVQFIVPSGSISLLRALPGFEDFDGATEVLRMLRAGFGLKDAPRAWAKVLKKVLETFGLVACKLDPQVYVKFVSGILVLILSTHVDDLKGAGETAQRDGLIAHLEARFGKLSKQLHSFTHVGVVHEQSPTTFEVEMHQKPYAQQLRQICLDSVATQDPDTPVDTELKGCFATLLGGTAWMTLTVTAIAVYVSFLQRHLTKPTVKHLKDLNRLVQWVTTHPQSLWFRPLRPPLRLVAVSDSSFSAGDTQGLVMRGCILLLMGSDPDAERWEKNVRGRGPCPGGRCQVIDWFSRKQQHVCRSTFAAELHGALDAFGQALIVQQVFTEVLVGPQSSAELSKRQSSGQLQPPLHLCLDARSVYDSIVAPRASTPADRTMAIHVLSVREYLRDGLIQVIWWIDTMDMLADGLTKGVVDRKALIAVSSSGQWRFIGDVPASTETSMVRHLFAEMGQGLQIGL